MKVYEKRTYPKQRLGSELKRQTNIHIHVANVFYTYMNQPAYTHAHLQPKLNKGIKNPFNKQI